jgi:hypothetical protein
MNRWLFLGLAVLLIASCTPVSTSDGDGSQYNGPIEKAIAKEEFLPGTDIKYLGKTEDGAEVAIGGQRALKKPGDSRRGGC